MEITPFQEYKRRKHSYDDCKTVFEIVTAKSIYDQEKVDKSIWFLKEKYWEFKRLMNNKDVDAEIKIQAWQYVKAYTKLLKDYQQWDRTKGYPIKNPKWADLDPKSQEWIDHWMHHPEEHFSMMQFRKHYRTMKKGGENAR